MIRPSFVSAFFAALSGLCLVMTSPASAQPQQNDPPGIELPITRAVLFSSGVGYFEHDGQVADNGSMRLMFKTEQINDVLKSMVLMDMGGGSITSVNYTSNEPIDRALRSFGVDISGDPSLADLLTQLRGATLKVALENGSETGKLLNIERRTRPVGDPPTAVEEIFLNLVTAKGIRSIKMSEVMSLEVTDKKLQDELNKALALLIASRDTERKPVDIQFVGQGKRRVRVGYLVETPVWKTSYRLDLSDDKPLLQGWAIVENTSDNDWKDVALSLVSGRPISFTQDLYTPLYLERPEVKPKLFASLRPQMYEEGLDRLAATRELASANRRRDGRQAALAEAAPMAPMASMAAKAMRKQNFAGGAAYFADEAKGKVSLQQGVQAMASGGNVGELFQFTIQHPVTLERRRSAMLPIINQAIDAEKVSIYNQSVLKQHPLNGVYLTNNTGLKMMAGPVTVFDAGTYAGDAQIDHLAPKDKRLISYAVDLNVTVDPSSKSNSKITTARIVRGVLYVSQLYDYTQNYTIKNKAGEKRTVIIEHPFNSSRKLIKPEKYEEKTPSLYRFRVPVDANDAGVFTVHEQQTTEQRMVLLRTSSSSYLSYSRNGDVPQKVRDALAEAARMHGALNSLQNQRSQLNRQLDSIKKGQERLRENLKVVGANSDVGKRYLEKLSAEEDQIESLEKRVADMDKQIDQQQKMLETYLGNLTVE